MISDPLFYLVAIPAVFLTALSKGGFGGGLGLLGVPMLALVIPPQQAAAILLPVLCLMDLVSMWSFRGHYHRHSLLRLLPAALLGIMAGALSFRYLSADMLRLIVATIAIGFSLNFWLKPALTGAKQPSSRAAIGWGVLAGFTSFSVHAGGPPLNAYLLPLQLPRKVYAGTCVLFFSAVNFIKLVPYGLLGQFSTALLATSAVLAMLAPLGVLSGVYLHHRISDRWFYRLCYGLLMLTGLKLLYDGLT